MVWDFLDQVRAIVGRQESHPGTALGWRQRAQELPLVPRPQAQEEIFRFGSRQRPETLQAVFRYEKMPRLQEIFRGEALGDIGFEIGWHGTPPRTFVSRPLRGA